MSYVVVIPARYASSRLPGKPLLDIAGKPMIQRVYEQACLSQAKRVVVATDDERIAQCVESFGGEVCITAATHQSGTERLAEVVEKLHLDPREIVVNIQGDEPLIPPVIVDQVAHLIVDDEQAPMATLASPMSDQEEINDPNVVKIVCNAQGRAMYFSRAPIPYARDGQWPLAHYLHHIGIYAYRAGFVKQYIELTPSPIESLEKLEQLRVLWHGYHINVAAVIENPGVGVDTQDDLEKVRRMFAMKRE